MIPSLYPLFQKWCSKGSIWIISDTHFEDTDCKLIDSYWLDVQAHLNVLKNYIYKNDTLIHLGDVGNPIYMDQLKAHKVLLTGNHDKLSQMTGHFDEIFTGPLFISDRILLSHEPIYGLEGKCLNIHGHDHGGVNFKYDDNYIYYTHINLASNVCNYVPCNLGAIIKCGCLKNIKNYHRETIDNATLNSIIGNKHKKG